MRISKKNLNCSKICNSSTGSSKVIFKWILKILMSVVIAFPLMRWIINCTNINSFNSSTSSRRIRRLRRVSFIKCLIILMVFDKLINKEDQTNGTWIIKYGSIGRRIKMYMILGCSRIISRSGGCHDRIALFQRSRKENSKETWTRMGFSRRID